MSVIGLIIKILEGLPGWIGDLEAIVNLIEKMKKQKPVADPAPKPVPTPKQTVTIKADKPTPKPQDATDKELEEIVKDNTIPPQPTQHPGPHMQARFSWVDGTTSYTKEGE